MAPFLGGMRPLATRAKPPAVSRTCGGIEPEDVLIVSELGSIVPPQRTFAWMISSAFARGAFACWSQ